MYGFEGKVALITGSSSGIGAATAVFFAKNGCRKVTLTGRNKSKLDGIEKQCISAGMKPDDILVVTGDLSDTKVVEEMVNKTIDKFGRLDILVNNAGMADMSSVENGTMESFERTMNTNVRAPVLLSKLCAPHLAKTKGSIVNVSSIAGLRPMFMTAYYSMSKAALDQFTKILAHELGPKGVRVNSVNPGMVKTDIVAGLMPPGTDMNVVFENAAKDYPLGRIGEPEDIARAIAFLASNKQSPYTTGQLLALEGGLLLGIPTQNQLPADLK